VQGEGAFTAVRLAVFMVQHDTAVGPLMQHREGGTNLGGGVSSFTGD